MPTQFESNREMGSVTLGHTFSCGHVIISRQRWVHAASTYLCISLVLPSVCMQGFENRWADRDEI